MFLIYKLALHASKTYFAKKYTLKKLICLLFLTAIIFETQAQSSSLTVNRHEFLVDKKVVAKIKDVKLGSFQGREMRLLGANDEFLLGIPVKTLTVGNPPRYINYASIYVPALNDSIQIRIDSLQADGVKIGLTSPNEAAWADYFFRKNIVNQDGSLNMESIKALKNRYPIGVVKDYEQKTAFASQCNKIINTPTKRNTAMSANITEISRETIGNNVVIKYKVEHDGTVLGEITAKGGVVNLANERAEVDFKPKVFYKKADMENQPMSFEIINPQGCTVATYSPMSKVLNTVRADKGGTHGIMKPVLDGKVESIKTRLEVVTAMVDYLIKLGYI